MKLAVLTPLWRRPEIASIFKQGILENQRYLRGEGIELELFTVLSPEDPNYSELKELFPNSVECSNEFLGRKKNFGLTQALNKDWDYLLELGSDDILSNKYFDIIDWDSLFFGMYQVFMFDWFAKELYLMKGYKWKDVLGGGRFIHRRLCHQNLWADQGRIGMDSESERIIWSKFRIKAQALPTYGRPYLVDIKTLTNLHTIHEQKRLGVLEKKPVSILDEYFSKEILKNFT